MPEHPTDIYDISEDESDYDPQALAGESEYERTPSKETAITNNENDQIRESVINHNKKCCNCTRERLKD